MCPFVLQVVFACLLAVGSKIGKSKIWIKELCYRLIDIANNHRRLGATGFKFLCIFFDSSVGLNPFIKQIKNEPFRLIKQHPLVALRKPYDMLIFDFSCYERCQVGEYGTGWKYYYN